MEMSNLTEEPCKAKNFRLYHSGLRNDISGRILERTNSWREKNVDKGREFRSPFSDRMTGAHP